MRDFLFFHGLRRRVALKAALILGGLLCLFAVVMTAGAVANHRAQEIRRATIVAESYAQRVAEAAARSGALTGQGVDVAMNEAVLQRPVLYVSVTSSNGQRMLRRGLFESAWEATDERLLRNALQRGSPVTDTRQGVSHVVWPIQIQGRLAGVAQVSASMGGGAAGVLTMLRDSLFAALLGLGLVLPLAGLILVRATAPVRQIIDAAQAVARGRLDTRLDIRTGDERQELAEGVNAMLDRLRGSLEHVRQLAYADHLTGLPNHTAFLEHARAALAAPGQGGALFLIDLDRFKRLNDTYGSRQGDRLIRVAAQRVQVVCAAYAQTGCAAPATVSDALAGQERKTILARLTADEFALLVVGPPSGFAPEIMAAEIIKAIGQPTEILKQSVVTTASVGIVAFPPDGAQPDQLLRNANLALDEAKEAGGADFRMFDESMTRAAVARVTLERELRRAVERNEFVVHYQPKVAARSGVIMGAEALVRWRHPDGTLRAPGGFIQLAEETGLIVDIGDFVLREACRAAARWRASGMDMQVAVNVSALQFERETFRSTVQAALDESGLDAGLLELEITESTAMTDPERALAQIEPLRRLGVRFAIDDFGAGHSSLAHLSRMPFDTFKIDQSFVRALGVDPNAHVIVQTILALARSLRLDVVAEGAETAEQVAMLRSFGCNFIQGFYFARPMAEQDLLIFVNNAPKDLPARASAGVVTPFSGGK